MIKNKSKGVYKIKICVANLVKLSGPFHYLYTVPACLFGFPRVVNRLEPANWKWDQKKKNDNLRGDSWQKLVRGMQKLKKRSCLPLFNVHLNTAVWISVLSEVYCVTTQSRQVGTPIYLHNWLNLNVKLVVRICCFSWLNQFVEISLSLDFVTQNTGFGLGR